MEPNSKKLIKNSLLSVEFESPLNLRSQSIKGTEFLEIEIKYVGLLFPFKFVKWFSF